MYTYTQSGTLLKNTWQNYPTLSVTSLTGEEKQRFCDYKNGHLPNANVWGPMQMQLVGKFQQPCLWYIQRFFSLMNRWKQWMKHSRNLYYLDCHAQTVVVLPEASHCVYVAYFTEFSTESMWTLTLISIEYFITNSSVQTRSRKTIIYLNFAQRPWKEIKKCI